MSFGRIPEDVIEAVRAHHDIVDVISRYVHLKKSGRNFVGLCPFHSEKTPSFSVKQDKQMFYCFGCGVGGNVITFLMEVESYSFMEAIKELAKEAGIELPEAEPVIPKENDEKKVMFQAHELAAKWFHHVLLHTPYGQPALSYLQSRGFTAETIQTFQIGFAPSSWDALTSFLKKRGFALPLMERAGLLSGRADGKSFVDRFRNRVMFPIFDSQGRVIAFGGRVLDQSQPKYLNSPETLLFNKSRNLYNFNLARSHIRKSQQVVLFEGYVDVISSWQAGITNGVATLGTSLTEEHARIMSRNAEQVILCYDADDAGQSAAFRSLELLQNAGSIVKIAQMPKNLDPDDYIRRYGGEHFKQEVIGGATSLTAFKLQHLRKGFNLADDQERMKYIRKAIEAITELRHPIERDHYLRQLSEEFKISLDALKIEQRQIYLSNKKNNSGDNPTKRWNNNINNGKFTGQSSPLLPAFHNAERTLIGLMMKHPWVSHKVQEELGDRFNVEEYGAMAAYLYAFYAKADSDAADPAQFIHQLQDESLIRLATSIWMMEWNEHPTNQEIEDYIRQSRNHPKWLEIEKKKEEILKSERLGDPIRAAQIAQEKLKLEQELKNL